MNDSRFVIGVTGPMQTGKQELGPTWSRLGATFVDLNAYADAARVKYRSRYDALGLGDAIGPDGKKSGVFYSRILAEPRLHRATMETELPHVATAVKERLHRELSGTVVLSWGYLYQLFAYDIAVNHVVFCRSAQPIWLGRIQARASQIGLVGLDDDATIKMADTLGMNPDSIEHEVATAYHGRWTKFDTSDYGAAETNLGSLLASLIG